jgi:glycosyltransferase involved in cell wall biosynthesis
MTKSLNILVSAYACRPGEGSEPGVGWHIVRELSQYHRIWMLTRQNNRPAIEAALLQHPIAHLQVVYCEPPRVIQKLNRNQRIVHLHYYLWQLQAYRVARQLHRSIGFDVAHHITYVRYSSPSFLSLLPVPFIWGPVGGAEMAPLSFWTTLGARGKSYEIARFLSHRLGELDPFTHLTARRSALSRATTEETAQRLRHLGAKHVELDSESGLHADDISRLGQCALPAPSPLRFISMARLLHWKGLHLGLRAFAQARLSHAEYWVVGDGAERDRLEALAGELGIAPQVRFFGRLNRHETLRKLSASHVLVHPSLHDSGGWVCLEAMAAGRPVICLDLGGPAVQVTAETGIKIPAYHPQQAVTGIANAMHRLATDAILRQRMGQAGRQRVREQFAWDVKGRSLAQRYADIATR